MVQLVQCVSSPRGGYLTQSCVGSFEADVVDSFEIRFGSLWNRSGLLTETGNSPAVGDRTWWTVLVKTPIGNDQL